MSLIQAPVRSPLLRPLFTPMAACRTAHQCGCTHQARRALRGDVHTPVLPVGPFSTPGAGTEMAGHNRAQDGARGSQARGGRTQPWASAAPRVGTAAAEAPPTAGPPQHLRVRMRVTHHQGEAQAGQGPCGQGGESLCWSRPLRPEVPARPRALSQPLQEPRRWVFLNLLSDPISVTPVLQRRTLRLRGPDACPGQPGGGWLRRRLPTALRPPCHPLLPSQPRYLSSTCHQGPVNGPSCP